MMGSRFPSHQLSNGLYVLGWPEQPKERPPTMSSVAMLYTGGDLKKSGELGKLFDIPTDGSKAQKSGPITSDPIRTGSFGDLQAPGYISTGALLLRMEQRWRRSGGMKYQFRVEDLIADGYRWSGGDFKAKPGSPIFKCPRSNEVVYGDVYMLDDENQWKVLPSMPNQIPI